uniref:Uncharacterized protein n=1 Tax=Arundo donax TaxID=35708 RepID=A0A0A9APF3_ARUDO
MSLFLESPIHPPLGDVSILSLQSLWKMYIPIITLGRR